MNLNKNAAKLNASQFAHARICEEFSRYSVLRWRSQICKVREGDSCCLSLLASREQFHRFCKNCRLMRRMVALQLAPCTLAFPKRKSGVHHAQEHAFSIRATCSSRRKGSGIIC